MARDLLHTWLREQTWPGDPADDLVLAVSEAVSNAVEHAYPSGTPREWVEIEGVIEPAPAGPDGAPQRRARVEIRDEGRWRPRLVEIDDLARPRGRGLPLMRALTALVTIDTGGFDRGTWVTLLSRPVPIASIAARAAPAPPPLTLPRPHHGHSAVRSLRNAADIGRTEPDRPETGPGRPTHPARITRC